MKVKILGLFTAIALAILMVVLLPACAAPGPAPTPGPGEPEEVIEITFGQFYSGAGFGTEISNMIADWMKEQSGGRLQSIVYLRTAVAPIEAHLPGLAEGLFDLLYLYEGYYKAEQPVFDLTSVPNVLLREPDDIWKLYQLAGMKELMTEVYDELGMVYIGNVGKVSDMLMARVPIPSVDDVAGLKFRSIGRNAAALTSLGASAVNIESSEVYVALASGLIDGADLMGVDSSYTDGYYEVAKYWVQPNLTAVNTHAFAANPDFWNNTLTEADRSIIENAFLYAAEVMLHKQVYTQDSILAKVQAENGVTVNYWSEEDLVKWQAALIDVTERYDSDPNWAAGWAIMEDYARYMGYIE